MQRWPLVVLFAGCAPTVVFRGRSPDGRHAVEIVDSRGRQGLRLDGAAGPPWLGIGPRAIAFCGDHLAYAARVPGGWSVIRDGRSGPIFDAILDRSLRWNATGERLAFAATRGPRTFVVDDDRPGPGGDGVSLLGFSDDGAHLAYLLRRGDLVIPILDGRELPAESAVAELALDGRGRRLGLVARRDRKWTAVIDGVASPGRDRVSDLVFSSDGAHVAWAERRGAEERVVEDGVGFAPFERIAPRSLRFSPDGAHLAWVAQRGGKAWAVTDGVAGRPFDAAAPPVFSVDGHLGWSVREGGVGRVIVDGVDGAAWDEVRDLRLRPGGRPLYVARRGESERIVDGRTSIPFDLVLEASLAATADGRHYACIAGSHHDRALFLVVDGARADRVWFGEMVDPEAMHAAVAAALARAARSR